MKTVQFGIPFGLLNQTTVDFSFVFLVSTQQTEQLGMHKIGLAMMHVSSQQPGLHRGSLELKEPMSAPTHTWQRKREENCQMRKDYGVDNVRPRAAKKQPPLQQLLNNS